MMRISRMNLHKIALLLPFLGALGCVDGRRITDSNEHSSATHQPLVSDGGVIRGTVELPFALASQHPDDWFFWGRFPEHEEIWIPAGAHEIEFEVTGGVRFTRTADAPWQVDRLDDVYIGPGGIRSSPEEWFPALRLQMGFVHADFEGLGYPPQYVWQAEPYSNGPARKRVVLTGPGRIVFNRHYNSNWWYGLNSYSFEGRPMWLYYTSVSDQKVQLTIRPLAELRVACTGDLGESRVTRGEELTCTATSDSEFGQVEIETWSFSGTDSQGQPYIYPEEMDGGITDNPWRGKMAISGIVTVRATVSGGEPKSRSIPITVEARDWKIDLPLTYNVSKVTYAEFPGAKRPPLYPQNVHDLGNTHFGWEPIESISDFAEQIADHGPNHYLTFLKRVPARSNVLVLVHPEMETRGVFWRRQATGRPAFSERPPCVQNQFDHYVQLILSHEGYPPNPQSHSGVYLAEFTRLVAPDMEQLVYPMEARAQMITKADELLTRASDAAYVAAKTPVDLHYAIPFGCEFDFAPR